LSLEIMHFLVSSVIIHFFEPKHYPDLSLIYFMIIIIVDEIEADELAITIGIME
tara:strand:+ start:3197 stop:3358 length:162 start_codon:yes stop_codon:yes gene_type:complete